MTKHRPLGDLQLAILRILWQRGQASASEVHQALLPERGLAITTIKTMLRKMDDRGLVAHEEEGRTFLYRPTIQEGDARSGSVGELLKRFFSGDGAALVHHLVEQGEVDLDELDALRDALDARKKEE